LHRVVGDFHRDIRREAKVHAKGKLTARERIYALLDDDPFVELDALASPRYFMPQCRSMISFLQVSALRMVCSIVEKSAGRDRVGRLGRRIRRGAGPESVHKHLVNRRGLGANPWYICAYGELCGCQR
jgi:hypothetical protein